jgi:hypothetical protein
LPLGTLITERVLRIHAAIPFWRKIMHTRSIAVILAGLILASCSQSSPNSRDAVTPFVDSALRLDLSFGDDGLPEEFLLAEPRGLAVKDNGDILVADEHSLKIYDAGGRPKERLGRQGEGPGEFQGAADPLLGPTGFLSVTSGFAQFNLYWPDNTYMSRYNASADPALRDLILGEELTFSYVKRMAMLDTNRRIYALFGRNRNLPGRFPDFEYLYYSDGNSLKELIQHNSLASVLNDRGGSTSSPYLGDFHWGLLDENRIVHAHTHQGDKQNGPSSSYALNILDLDSGSSIVIDVDYEPTVLPDSLRTLMTYRNRRINLTIEPPPALQALLNETKFFPAFKVLRTEGDLVFLFRFNPVNEELERTITEAERNGEELPEGIYARFEPCTVDIVDTVAGRLITRAEFSCIPDVIKNGRAYRLNTRKDAFPKVECYRIDPAVYRADRFPQ